MPLALEAAVVTVMLPVVVRLTLPPAMTPAPKEPPSGMVSELALLMNTLPVTLALVIAWLTTRVTGVFGAPLVIPIGMLALPMSPSAVPGVLANRCMLGLLSNVPALDCVIVPVPLVPMVICVVPLNVPPITKLPAPV